MERNYPIECHCHQCGSVTVIYVHETDYVKRVNRRSPVQNCFPYLTMPERETVISGMCVWSVKRGCSRSTTTKTGTGWVIMTYHF